MKGITVSVDYAGELALTLPRNAKHFDEVLVVTSPADMATQDVVAAVPNASMHLTNAFFRDGAAFNKGLALNEGFKLLQPDGWTVIFDADVVMPDGMYLSDCDIGKLYSPRRRLCKDPREYTGQTDWRQWPIITEIEHAGFFQLFHTDDPAVVIQPWYDPTWVHAGGADSFFQARWPKQRKVWLPFYVLHLGDTDRNWYGRQTAYLNGTVPEYAAERREDMERMRRERPKYGFSREKLP